MSLDMSLSHPKPTEPGTSNLPVCRSLAESPEGYKHGLPPPRRWTRVIATSLGRAVFSFFFLRDSPVVTVKIQTNSQPMRTFVPYISPPHPNCRHLQTLSRFPLGCILMAWTRWTSPGGLAETPFSPEHPKPLRLQAPICSS